MNILHDINVFCCDEIENMYARELTNCFHYLEQQMLPFIKTFVLRQKNGFRVYFNSTHIDKIIKKTREVNKIKSTLWCVSFL